MVSQDKVVCVQSPEIPIRKKMVGQIWSVQKFKGVQKGQKKWLKQLIVEFGDVKILQVIVDQLGFAYEETYDEDENENEEENHENEEELYDKEIADIKSRDFLTKNLEHLDEMEMDIKKSRKNLRVKFQRYNL